MAPEPTDFRREELNAILKTICPNVYFQPPSNVQMTYPCIRYERAAADTVYAGNKPYRRVKRYQVYLIDRNPDSGYFEKISDLPMCEHDRFYTADNLNHDVFTLFF